MASYDFDAPRLHVEPALAADTSIALDRTSANYLLSVLRLGNGDEVLVFNGRDGEWLARIAVSGRKSASLEPVRRVREQTRLCDLVYVFAPLKHARLDYMVQKAVEMGVGRLQPAFMRRSVASRVNRDRMRANAVEAAEQCGILSVPEIAPEADLPAVLATLEHDRLVVFCDEDAPLQDPVAALTGAPVAAGLALVVGPEGGFAPEERDLLMRRTNLRRISLGPRILRADTAAVAALALVQGVLGDWREGENLALRQAGWRPM